MRILSNFKDSYDYNFMYDTSLPIYKRKTSHMHMIDVCGKNWPCNYEQFEKSPYMSAVESDSRISMGLSAKSKYLLMKLYLATGSRSITGRWFPTHDDYFYDMDRTCWGDGMESNAAYLGIGGKIYALLSPLSPAGDKDEYGHAETSRFYFSKLKDAIPFYTSGKYKKYGKLLVTRYEEMKKVFTMLESRIGDKDYSGVFRELGCPLFMVTERQLILNPCLGRVKSTHTRTVYPEKSVIYPPESIYQGIEMWLSMESSTEVKEVELSDVLMRDSKGFGNKSFKSDCPSEKKSRRKENRKQKHARKQLNKGA